MKLQRMHPTTRNRVGIILVALVVATLLMRYIGLHVGSPTSTEEELQVAGRQFEGAPVMVLVFYEALCPDSKHFIIKQMLPAYKKAPSIMELQLVPYGKATTTKNPDGTYSFECQHGPLECEANRYHACSLAHISDKLDRLEMIACMIKDNRLPREAMVKCAQQLSIDDIDIIQKCYDSAEGGDRLNIYGEATGALHPHVSFIPTITLDGSQNGQAAILKNFLAEVCKIAGDMPEAKEPCKKV